MSLTAGTFCYQPLKRDFLYLIFRYEIFLGLYVLAKEIDFVLSSPVWILSSSLSANQPNGHLSGDIDFFTS